MNANLHHLLIYPPFWLALLPAAAVAIIGNALRWLTVGGALATAVIGLLIYWLGDAQAAIPVVAFFVASSLLSCIRLRKPQHTAIKPGGPARDAWQVWANGGVATALVVMHWALGFHVTIENNRNVQILFLAAIATVNSDTWATEIGSRWGGKPRLLSNWRLVPGGTSGAVSLLGTTAALAGALFIPLCAYRLWGMTPTEFIAVAWAAMLGCLLDSILGAGIQGQYRQTDTGEITDYPGTSDRRLVRGLPWVNNNVVNLVASAAGAFFCWVILYYGLRNVV